MRPTADDHNLGRLVLNNGAGVVDDGRRAGGCLPLVPRAPFPLRSRAKLARRLVEPSVARARLVVAIRELAEVGVLAVVSTATVPRSPKVAKRVPSSAEGFAVSLPRPKTSADRKGFGSGFDSSGLPGQQPSSQCLPFLYFRWPPNEYDGTLSSAPASPMSSPANIALRVIGWRRLWAVSRRWSRANLLSAGVPAWPDRYWRPCPLFSLRSRFR